MVFRKISHRPLFEVWPRKIFVLRAINPKRFALPLYLYKTVDTQQVMVNMQERRGRAKCLDQGVSLLVLLGAFLLR